VTPKNLILALKDQLPLSRAFRNFLVTGVAWGLFSPNSHTLLKTGLPKVTYGSKDSALKAACSMEKKYSGTFSAYKCAFCDGYHVGRSRTREEASNRKLKP
jgi:hypothetical protein